MRTRRGSPGYRTAWERTRTLDEALELPLRAFDALVIEANKPEATADALPRLGGVAHRPRVVVLLQEAAREHAESLRAAGADAVVMHRHPLQRLEELEGWLDAPPPPPAAPEAPATIETIVARSPAMRRTLALVERASLPGDRAPLRRDGHGQGGARARHPLGKPAPRSPVRGGELRGLPRHAA